jgi:hypothetical protein
MPFTTSHPAIVLPLKQIWPGRFSLTGLVAGAMAPDLLYFLMAVTTYRGVSHSWPGLVAFCLPAGVLFAVAFHKLFKSPFLLNLPRPLDRVFSGLAEKPFRPAGLKGWLVLGYSVLIGSLSHFFWDSFTHPTGQMAHMIPFLTDQATILGLTRSYARFLQHVSTILGGIVFLLFLFRSRFIPPPTRRTSPLYKPGEKLRFWLICGLVALVYACLAVWFYNGLYNWQIEAGYNRSLAWMTFGLGSWAGFFWAVCVYSVVRHFRQRKAAWRLS